MWDAEYEGSRTDAQPPLAWSTVRELHGHPVAQDRDARDVEDEDAQRTVQHAGGDRPDRPPGSTVSAAGDQDAHSDAGCDGGRQTDPGVQPVAGDQRTLRDGGDQEGSAAVSRGTEHSEGFYTGVLGALRRLLLTGAADTMGPRTSRYQRQRLVRTC